MGCFVVLTIVGLIFGILGYFIYRDSKHYSEFERRIDEVGNKFQQQRELRTMRMELDDQYVIVCPAEKWPGEWKRFNYEVIRPHEKFYIIRFSFYHDGDNHF